MDIDSTSPAAAQEDLDDVLLHVASDDEGGSPCGSFVCFHFLAS